MPIEYSSEKARTHSIKLLPHRALRTPRTLHTELCVTSHIVNKRRSFICSYSEHSVRSALCGRSFRSNKLYETTRLFKYT
jgi:hypothetical protein